MKKKRLLAFVLSICMLFGFATALPQGAFTDNAGITANAYFEHSEQYSNSRNFDNLSFEDAKHFYYNQLTDSEKHIYDKIKAAEGKEYSFTIQMGQDYNARRALSALISDEPMYHVYYERFLEFKTKNESMSLEPVRNPYATQYNINKVKASAKQIAQTVKSSDRYTTLVKLWDYVTRNIPYNSKPETDVDEYLYKSLTYDDCALGGFIAHTAVCAGLSHTVKILCDELEIPCVEVGNEGHEWNFIEMEDGKWYSVDCAIITDYERADSEDYDYLDSLLIGYNDNGYSGDSRYFLGDTLYIGNMDDNFSFPLLADHDYVYKGSNKDFSYTLVESEFVEPKPTFIYEVNEDGKTCSITDYYGKQQGDLVIPRVIDGYIVTAIGPEAFYCCKGFDGKIIIPDTVSQIGVGSFFWMH